MRKRFSIHHLLPGLSLVFTLFIFAPVDQYLSNADEFWFSLGDLAMWLGIFSLAAFAVITLLSAFLPAKASVAFRAAVYAWSFMAYIQGNLLVIDYGTLNGQEIDWAAHTGQYILHGALWIAVTALFIFLMFRLRKKFRRILEIAACVLLVTQAVSLGVFLIRNGAAPKEPERYLSVKNEFSLSEDSNTLVFILDTFDAHLMEELLNKYPEETAERFADFTWYRNTVGGATRTKYAIPFILTGDTNREEQSYTAYLKKGFAASPLIAELASGKYDSGAYTVSSYVDKTREDAFGNISTGRPGISSQFGLTKQFMKLVAYRYLPSVFSRYFWMYTGDFERYKSSAGDAAYSLNDPLFYGQMSENGISAGIAKPVFRLYHLKGAHAPFVYDENLEPVSPEEASEEKQALGSLKIVDDFLYGMEDWKIYDRANIVIMADHGLRPRSEQEQTPLLMIKRAGETHPFEISDIPLSFTSMPEILTAALQGKLESLEPFRTEGARYFYVQDEENAVSSITEYRIDGPAMTAPAVATGNVYHEDTLHRDRSYQPGTTIRFDEQNTARNYIVSGFSKNEGNFTWTDGHNAELCFELPDVPGALLIRLEHGIFGEKQQVEVLVNDRSVGTYTAENRKTAVYTVEIPAGTVSGKELNIRLHLPDAAAPADLNPTESDPRMLGLSMVSMTIRKK